MAYEKDLEATELRLGLPGSCSPESEIKQEAPLPAKSNKRSFPDMSEESSMGSRDNNHISNCKNKVQGNIPPSKAQVVGWPPVRSYMKNCLQAKKTEVEGGAIFVKVSMDGAPYLRKIDLKLYKGYPELFKALENMFKFKTGENLERGGSGGSSYVPTYEDKDGDWMLVGDVPWVMFINSCKRLRIMKGSEARGLGCAL